MLDPSRWQDVPRRGKQTRRTSGRPFAPFLSLFQSCLRILSKTTKCQVGPKQEMSQRMLAHAQAVGRHHNSDTISYAAPCFCAHNLAPSPTMQSLGQHQRPSL